MSYNEDLIELSGNLVVTPETTDAVAVDEKATSKTVKTESNKIEPKVDVPLSNNEAIPSADVAVNTPIPTTATAQVVPSIPLTPEQKAKRKKSIVLASVIIGVVAVGLLSVVIVNNTAFSAQNDVKAYLDAISSGDIQKAIEISKPSINNDELEVLKAIEIPEGQRITDVVITKSNQKNDDNTSVAYDVTYRENNVEVHKTVNLQKTDNQYLLFDKWKITSSLINEVPITAPKEVNNIAINDTTISLENRSKFYLFPGVYKITLPEDKYIKLNGDYKVYAENQKISLSSDNLSLTDDLQTKLQEQVNAVLSKCVQSSGEQVPDECPFSALSLSTYSGSYYSYNSYKWSVTKSPKVTVKFGSEYSYNNSSSGITTITMTAKDGEVKCDYIEHYSGGSYSYSHDYPRSTTRTVSLSSYSFKFQDGEPVLVDPDGKVIITDPASIEEMKANEQAIEAAKTTHEEKWFVTNHADYGICVRSTPKVDGTCAGNNTKGANVLLYINKGDVSIRLKYLNEEQMVDGYKWLKVETPSSGQGWVREDIVKVG